MQQQRSPLKDRNRHSDSFPPNHVEPSHVDGHGGATTATSRTGDDSEDTIPMRAPALGAASGHGRLLSSSHGGKSYDTGYEEPCGETAELAWVAKTDGASGAASPNALSSDEGDVSPTSSSQGSSQADWEVPWAPPMEIDASPVPASVAPSVNHASSLTTREMGTAIHAALDAVANADSKRRIECPTHGRHEENSVKLVEFSLGMDQLMNHGIARDVPLPTGLGIGELRWIDAYSYVHNGQQVTIPGVVAILEDKTHLRMAVSDLLRNQLWKQLERYGDFLRDYMGPDPANLGLALANILSSPLRETPYSTSFKSHLEAAGVETSPGCLKDLLVWFERWRQAQIKRLPQLSYTCIVVHRLQSNEIDLQLVRSLPDHLLQRVWLASEGVPGVKRPVFNPHDRETLGIFAVEPHKPAV